MQQARFICVLLGKAKVNTLILYNYTTVNKLSVFFGFFFSPKNEPDKTGNALTNYDDDDDDDDDDIFLIGILVNI